MDMYVYVVNKKSAHVDRTSWNCQKRNSLFSVGLKTTIWEESTEEVEEGDLHCVQLLFSGTCMIESAIKKQEPNNSVEAANRRIGSELHLD